MTKEVAGYPRFRPSAAVREMGAAQDALAWTLPLISETAAHAVRQPGDWSIAMNLAHLVVYEERIAMPVLAALADGADGNGVVSGEEDWLERETERSLTSPMPRSASATEPSFVGTSSSSGHSTRKRSTRRCARSGRAISASSFPRVGLQRRASNTLGSTDTP